jgi:predicted RNA-binding protein with PIN domain
MPFLIDGNNLMHALAEASQGRLCDMLEVLARRGEQVCVVFDGAPPEAPLPTPGGEQRVEVVFASPRTADDVIADRIAASSAPRRLTVVSTDRQLRKCGRRRRCKVVTSAAFARLLLREISTPRESQPAEPPEKRLGLTKEQTRAWLREFDLEDDS